MEKVYEIHEVEVIYKRPKISSMPIIRNCIDVVDIFRDMITVDKIDLKEFFLVGLLSQSNHLLGVSKISIGSTGETQVNVKEILQLAIKTNASGVILCHNHPSGCLRPSVSDLKVTRKIKEVCTCCDISLLDHVIISSEGYYSLIDEI